MESERCKVRLEIADRRPSWRYRSASLVCSLVVSDLRRNEVLSDPALVEGSGDFEFLEEKPEAVVYIPQCPFQQAES